MKVKATILTTVAAVAIGCATSFSASADGGWKHPHRHNYYHGHYVYGAVVAAPVVVAPPVVYYERPVYVARPVYVERPVYYVPPPRPGVVVSVNLPPLVFPIR